MPSVNIKSIRNRQEAEPAPEPSEEQIRQRAFAIWESDGRPPGRAAQHWEQARRELAELRLAPARAR